MIPEIEKDLKVAMLAGDRTAVETLRGLKNALQYEAVGAGSKDRSLSDEQIQKVLAREAKKRQEAADLYKQGGSQQRANAELAEKKIIEKYLPEQLSEEEIARAVDEELTGVATPTPADMGKIIGAVRGKLGAAADGATIARLVKERLNK
jgi:uncharacterized protein YqeY